MGRRNLSTEFGRVLSRHRRARGLSQEALAHKARLHRTYVGLLERGLRNATLDVGERIARALDMSLSAMVREAEKRLRDG